MDFLMKYSLCVFQWIQIFYFSFVKYIITFKDTFIKGFQYSDSR